MTIYARGIVVSELLGIDFWYGAIDIVIFTGAYTIVGGMKAVIYMETLQTGVLIADSITITYLGLEQVGEQKEEAVGSYTWVDILFSVMLVVVVVAVSTYFTG